MKALSPVSAVWVLDSFYSILLAVNFFKKIIIIWILLTQDLCSIHEKELVLFSVSRYAKTLGSCIQRQLSHQHHGNLARIWVQSQLFKTHKHTHGLGCLNRLLSSNLLFVLSLFLFYPLVKVSSYSNKYFNSSFKSNQGLHWFKVCHNFSTLSRKQMPKITAWMIIQTSLDWTVVLSLRFC